MEQATPASVGLQIPPSYSLKFHSINSPCKQLQMIAIHPFEEAQQLEQHHNLSNAAAKVM
jgi:hypothetical protein